MNSSDPLVKDRGIIANRDHETSLALHRKNSIQRERLDQELKRIDKEQQECLRRTHLQMCDISRDQKCLVSDLTKVTLSDTASEEDEDGEEVRGDEVERPPTVARPKVVAPPIQKTRRRSDSMPAVVSDQSISAVSKKDKQEKFMDQKMSKEINRLKKASMRTEESKESDERKGKPRIPPNAWYHDNHNARARGKSSSVFDRLSTGSNMNSMSSEQFLQRVRLQRRYTVPSSLTVTGSRNTEQK